VRIHSEGATGRSIRMVLCASDHARNSEFCSDFVNRFMNLFSASEDLATRTLKHVNGTLRRLLYLVTLRDPDGNYHHWGMARVFGDEESIRAAQEAHKEVLNEVLRKSVRELWEELEAADRLEGRATKSEIQELVAQGRMVVPPGCSEAAECHLSSVLHALSELAQAPAAASTRPAA
jgi:Lon protease-like protein